MRFVPAVSFALALVVLLGSAAPLGAAGEQWYVLDQNRNTVGPLTADQVVAQGFNRETMVVRVGEQQWLAAGSDPILGPRLGAAPAAPAAAAQPAATATNPAADPNSPEATAPESDDPGTIFLSNMGIGLFMMLLLGVLAVMVLVNTAIVFFVGRLVGLSLTFWRTLWGLIAAFVGTAILGIGGGAVAAAIHPLLAVLALPLVLLFYFLVLMKMWDATFVQVLVVLVISTIINAVITGIFSFMLKGCSMALGG